jgi:hypothetical protein
MLLNEIPNSKWSADLSRRRGVGTRCPFATVEACPRFYQSLSLLGGAGFTKIPEAEDERLLKYWKGSDLWPRTDEQATSMFGESGNPSMFSNFCPEVTSDSFGLSATFLARYADEIDAESAHRRLTKDGAPVAHPGWSWAACTGQHFTDCSIYSVLVHRATNPSSVVPAKPEPWWRKYLAEILVAIAVAIVGVIAKLIG